MVAVSVFSSAMPYEPMGADLPLVLPASVIFSQKLYLQPSCEH